MEKNSSHLYTYIQSTFQRDIKVDKDDDLDLQAEEKRREKKKDSWPRLFLLHNKYKRRTSQRERKVAIMIKKNSVKKEKEGYKFCNYLS